MAKPFVNRTLADRGSDAEELASGFSRIRDIFGILLTILERDDLPRAAWGYDSVTSAAISLTDKCIRDADALADKLYGYAREGKEGETNGEKSR